MYYIERDCTGNQRSQLRYSQFTTSKEIVLLINAPKYDISIYYIERDYTGKRHLKDYVKTGFPRSSWMLRQDAAYFDVIDVLSVMSLPGN